MAKLVDPGLREPSEVAGQLLAIAAEQGYPVAVVQVTHDPGLIFSVPDEVADAYNQQIEAQVDEAPKRRRSARVDPKSEGTADD